MERTERGRRDGGNGKARGQERKQGGWGKDEGRSEAGSVGKGRRDRGRGRPSLCPRGLSSLPASIIKALQPPSTLPGSLPASRSASSPFHRSRCLPPRPAACAPCARPRQPIWGPDGPPPEPVGPLRQPSNPRECCKPGGRDARESVGSAPWEDVCPRLGPGNGGATGKKPLWRR